MGPQSKPAGADVQFLCVSFMSIVSGLQTEKAWAGIIKCNFKTSLKKSQLSIFSDVVIVSVGFP